MPRCKSPRTKRVRRFIREDFSAYQVLEEKRWCGWKEIDREEVPSYVNISLATVGDTGGWVSKFTKHGNFGRDGIIYLN